MIRHSRRCRRSCDLPAYLDGELRTDDALLFEEHLVACESCRASVTTQQKLEEALAELPRPRLLLPDRARLAEGIAQRIDAGPDRTAAAPAAPRWRRVAATLAVAAAIVLALFVPRPPRVSTPATTVPPAEPFDHEGGAAPLVDAAPHETEAAVGFEVPPTIGAVGAAARDELADVVRRLPRECSAIAGDDLLTVFAAAAQPLRACGVSVTTLLVALLRDPDPSLACAAADLLARAAARGELGRDEPTLAPALEQAMRRHDRGAAMVRALAAVGTPRACEGLARALQITELRPLAFEALAARGEPSFLPTLEAELRRVAREPDGEPATARLLSRLPVRRAEQLHLLAELVRGGVAREPIAAALAREEATAIGLLVIGLAERNGGARRDALLLAPISRDDALAGPLCALAVRGDDAAAALAALSQFGGARTLAAIVELAGESSLSRARRRQIEGAFSEVLDRTDDLPAALALVRRDQPDADDRLGELCRAARGAAGPAARAALLLQPGLPSGVGARVALELATRRERVDPDALVGLVADAATRRDDGLPDEGLTPSLLALLYSVDGEAGLTRGVREFGLLLPLSRHERLCDAARLVVGGVDGRRDLSRLDALLRLAP